MLGYMYVRLAKPEQMPIKPSTGDCELVSTTGNSIPGFHFVLVGISLAKGLCLAGD